MTPGHPEASGLSSCLGKPRTHLMTPAWSMSHRFFYPGLRMGNDNGLVNYCASRLRAHIRQGVLHDEKTGASWEQGSKLLRSYGISFWIIFIIWCQINVSSYLQYWWTPIFLMVLYCWFVCIINSIFFLKLKVKYTHNSVLRIMLGARMEMQLGL